MTASLIAVSLLAVLVIIIIVKTATIVPQKSEYIIERLGKYSKTLSAGFHVLVPFIDKVAYKFTLKEEVFDIPSQTCITKDNVTVEVDGLIYLQIIDSKLGAYGISDYRMAASQLAQTTLRSCVGRIDLDKTFEERETMALGHSLGGPLCRGDFAYARQEDQHVTIGGRAGHGVQCVGHSRCQWPRVRRGEELELHRMRFPFSPSQRASQVPGDGLPVQRRGHRGQLQVRTAGPLKVQQEGQRHVGLQVAFVELVQDHGRNAPEPGGCRQPAEEYPFRDKPQASRRAAHRLESDRVANGLSHVLPEFLSNAVGRQPHRESAWFENPNLATFRNARIEERRREPSRFPCAGRRLEDQRTALFESGHQLRNQRIDRQWSQAGLEYVRHHRGVYVVSSCSRL